MTSDSLCVGDNVCFFSEEAFGYLYSSQSSSFHSELAVIPKQQRDHPNVPDPQVISFEICIANRYKLNKKYRKLKAKAEEDPDNVSLKTQASQALTAAEAENEDNVTEQKRQQGKKVLYGQIVQLRHIFTNKYVHVSATQTSKTESSNMQVHLVDYNMKHAQFKIMPRYKVKAEGDVVQVDDQIILESVKSPGQFLHVSKATYTSHSVYSQNHELNLSVRQSGFTLYRRYKPEKEHENFLKAGDPIRLFHKEIEAYLVAEGLFDSSVTEDVHLRIRAVDQNKPKTLFPSTSAITFWQIELEDGPCNGSVVRWEQQCRLKHMTCRKYLRTDGKAISLTDNHLDPKTVFRLHPVIKETDQIKYETYCRLEHVVTSTWLHASSDEYQRKTGGSTKTDSSMANLTWTTASLRQLCLSEEMQYDDAFTLQQIPDISDFNYMAGNVLFLQKIITDKKNGILLTAKETHNVIGAMHELKKFMILNSVPNKNRQKLLRNLRVVELLVQLQQLPCRGSPDQHHFSKVIVECYDVLYTYLMGDSRKNELYIAKHIDFFESQIAYEGEIGLNAAHMVMELVKDNRKIVDRITHSHIDSFVDLLRINKNYRYLDLLSVLCVCDGVSIPDNQNYITEVWLMQGKKNCVFHTELGEKINRESNVVYVSRDNQKTWMALHDFVQQKKISDMKNDEAFLFLDHQLDLFGKLCYGRNEKAIQVITETLGYLTWEEAFICLTNEQLPDQLRAKYCHLIVALFVDVGSNTATLDRINLSFVWDEVGATKTETERQDEETRGNSSTNRYFPHLRDWISKFLDSNKDMTASMVGHNMLIEQVLKLVHYLAKFGYYGEMSDVAGLLEPLLSLVDGRNDKPYPNKQGECVSRDVLDKYRRLYRYKESPETMAIINAKHQAMEVLDLFFNFSFNEQLEQFVKNFKTTYSKAHHVVGGNPELGALLYESYDIYKNSSTNNVAMKLLRELIQSNDFFQAYPLKDVLMDLSHYEYEKMVVKSMTLLDRKFSALDNLFKRAVQAQVLITDRSTDVLKELHSTMPVIQRLVASKMTSEQTRTMRDILQKLSKLCTLENEPDEEHPMNQSILYNHGVLTILFDILSQEIDIHLLEQYSGIRDVFQQSFLLLKALARGNEVVQQRLFDRLDMILNIQGAEAEMANALIEVFTGNKQTCLKILSYQVQRIMVLAAQHSTKAPQFLDLLNAVVKVEELNLPLKRNQAYVMKYFMQYRAEVAHVIDQPREKREKLLCGPPCVELDYLIALVDLLATCAEGENRFIESICQTIFSVDELMTILSEPKMDSNLKRPYLRFFLWVYLNTAGGMIESGAGDLPHDKKMWKVITGLGEELNKITEFSKDNSETVKQLLKKSPSKSSNRDFSSPWPRSNSQNLVDRIMDDPDVLNSILSEKGNGEWKTIHGSLHYLLDAVVPFLQVFFHNYYQPDRENFPDEPDELDKLANCFVEFIKVVGPLISKQQQMKGIVGCMNVLLSASTLPVEVMEEFQEKYGGATSVQDIRSDARKKYEEYYDQEEELNAQLNIFSINYSTVYGGSNDLKTQLKFNSDKEYTDLGGDEELPLGEEFQEHVACFINPSASNIKAKYQMAGKLVEQLAISAANAQMNEKERVNQEVLDIKCLQLLRAIIHNEVVKLPDDWENDLKANRKQLKRIIDSQNALNDHMALLKVLPHLSKTGDDIVREVLAFLAAMLFGGNEDVQRSLIDYFLGTREENFFFALKNRMQLSALATKERRSLIAQHQAKVEEAIEQAKALRKALKTGQMAANEIKMANQMGSALLAVRNSRTSMGGKKGRNDALKGRYGKKSSNRMGSNRSMNRSQMMGSSLFAPKGIGGSAFGGGRLNVPGGMGAAQSSAFLQEDNMMQMPGKGDKIPLVEIMHIKDNKVSPEAQTPEVKIEELDETDLADLAAMSIEDGDILEYKDDGYIELVLKILGLVCDGQNQILQNYLREQLDNIKSVNLIAETARFLSLVYSSISVKTIGLVTELFSTLVEFTSGNLHNQVVVFDCKICDYINFILRGASFQGCSVKEILQLKKGIGTLVTAMIEENGQVASENIVADHKQATNTSKPDGDPDRPSSVEVAETLDAESIWQVSAEAYAKSLILPNGEMKEMYLDIGFCYFHLIQRIIDITEQGASVKPKLLKTMEDQAAWDHYSNGTLSIEIVKDDKLQKIYFRCKDKNVLREDAKEKFKYEVDRSSPSNKLREFMDWSKDIMVDIKYTRKVMSFFLSKFFVKYWWHFNMIIIFISFLFFILIMAFWKAPADSTNGTTVYKPEYLQYPDQVTLTTYVLGGIHNFFSFCVLVSFFISNHPTFPRFTRLRNFCKSLRKSRDLGDEEDDDDQERDSNLEVKFFSVKTFWYMLVFAFSMLGTFFYGYFFSFHLLHMANFNQLLKRAIQAVTKNGFSLLLVFGYMLAIVFMYAQLGFAFYRELFDSVAGLHCTTMYECAVTMLHRGAAIGIFEFLEVPEGKPFTYHLFKSIYDLTFFIIITTIGLNIIFGIIVDTFSELRDNKWQVDSDMHSTCFICSRNSYDFEHQGGGFEHHVKHEHNQWAYLFFFIHLDETRTNDYTALELYVSRLLERENYDFFPLNRALSLQHEEDNNELRLETLMHQVTYLVSKMKQEEADREREQEKVRQLEWERKHRNRAQSSKPRNEKP